MPTSSAAPRAAQRAQPFASFSLDPKQITQVVEGLLGESVKGDPAPLSGGMLSKVFVVETAQGKVVLKFQQGEGSIIGFEALRKEVWCATKVREAGQPTPAALSDAHRLRDLEPSLPKDLSVAAFEFLDAPSLMRLVTGGAADRATAWSCLGGRARAIHAIALPRHCWGTELDAAGATWKAGTWASRVVAAEHTVDANCGALKQHAVNPDTLLKVLASFKANDRLPVLIHLDLHLENALQPPHGALHLIDFGLAEPGVPYGELAAVLRPGLTGGSAKFAVADSDVTAFLDGYGMRASDVDYQELARHALLRSLRFVGHYLRLAIDGDKNGVNFMAGLKRNLEGAV